MVYKEFQDLKLSALGMGAMRLPVIDGKEDQIDEAAAGRIIDEAFAGGVNYYDTAWGYHGGQSELVMGTAPEEISKGAVLPGDQVSRL